jgi:hypothetical protein
MNPNLLKVLIAAAGTALIFLVGWWLVKGINKHAREHGFAVGQDKRDPWQRLKDMQKGR